MTVLVDTNVLVFDTFEDAELHEDARDKLDSQPQWHIPSIVFHEFMWFMRSQKVNLKFTKQKIEEYLMHEKTVFSPTQVDDILFAAKEVRNRSEYNDFVILSHSKRLGVTLFTYDVSLKKEATKRGVKTL